MKIDKKLVEKFGNMEILAKQVVEGFITGLHKSPFHGFSVEFAEHKIYNKGESTKHIDWKLFARTDKLFVKKYEEETNLRCQILIDSSASMYFPESDINFNKIEFSVYVSAALIELLKRQRDAIGLSTFTDRLHYITPTKSNLNHTRFLYTKLEELLVQKSTEGSTKLIDSLHHIAEKTHKRSLIVLFTDFYDNSNNEESILSALQHLKYNQHEIVIFHVLDHKTELDLNYENRPYIFTDKETGEKVKLNPFQIREVYKNNATQFADNIKHQCVQLGIDFVSVDVQENFDKVLMKYLIKRIKMLS